MTPEKFRAALTVLGWGERSLATRLQVNRRTVERWAAGEIEVEARVAGWLAGLAGQVADDRAAAIAARPLPDGWE